MLANVGHELRTPLAAIVGNAELLQDGAAGALGVDQQALVDRLQDAAQRLTRMVTFLLDFAQLDAGTFTFEMEVTDLRGLVADEVEATRARAEAAGLALELRLPEDGVPVELDPQRTAQVLANLLDNAIKFTPAGGRVVVTLVPAAGSATVQVRDTGIGIAPEHLGEVFKKFYQVDPSSTRERGGAGLGLAFSKAPWRPTAAGSRC